MSLTILTITIITELCILAWYLSHPSQEDIDYAEKQYILLYGTKH